MKGPERYLEYLDKEMTIMGILSTFCVAVPALMIERIFSTDNQSAGYPFLITLLSSGKTYLILGAILFFIGAAYFYKQRSHLAWHYGQIALEFTLPDYTEYSLDRWLKNADSWDTWFYYNCAFWIVVFGVIANVCAIISIWVPFLKDYDFLINAILILLMLLWIGLVKYNSKTHSYEQKLPYSLLIKNILHKKSNGIPHTKVYTRIAASKIHGVGVVAIQTIPKGTDIFPSDDNELNWINKKMLTGLSQDLLKLYKDFCIKKGEFFGCPKNFNELTPAWYINHSANPNVGCDDKYKFYALRDIKKGEELTVDYTTYSETIGRKLNG